MRNHYSLAVRGVLGPESDDLRKISVLGRQVVWTEGGIVYEADPEHACKVIHDLGPTPSSHGLDKPCVCETLREIEQEATELDCQCHSISEELFINGSPKLAPVSEAVSDDGETYCGLLGEAEEVGKVLGPLPAVDFAVLRHWNSTDRIAGLLGQRLGSMSLHPAVNVGWMRDIGWISNQDVEHDTADDRFVVWRGRTQCIRQVRR